MTVIKKIFPTHPFDDLSWYRLRVKLRNTRMSPHVSAHIYSVMEAIVKGVSSAVVTGSSEKPIVLFHITMEDTNRELREANEIELEIIFLQCDKQFAQVWREALILYLADDIIETNFEIAEAGEVEERTYARLEAERGNVPAVGELRLEFCSPLSFRRKKGKPRTYLSKEEFIHGMEKRFTQLFGTKIAYVSKEDDFVVLPYYWHYAEIKHRSRSQSGATQFIKGCAGSLYIKGHFTNILPFLILGSELHAGTKLSNSQGYFRIDTDSHGSFQEDFPDE